jgi:NADH-quinone oxidoreductase subunit N
MYLIFLIISFFSLFIISFLTIPFKTMYSLLTLSIILSASLLIFQATPHFFELESLFFELPIYYVVITLHLLFALYITIIQSGSPNAYTGSLTNPPFVILIYIYFITLQFILLSNDFLVLYINIELLSLTTYLLATIHQNRYTIEATLKYFIYNFLAGSFLILGLGIIYYNTGTIALSAIGNVNGIEGMIGVLLVFATLFFKLSIVPFHFWTPDLYEGAVYPVTALFTLLPKLVYFSLLIKLMHIYTVPTMFYHLFIILGIMSIVLGSISAYNQHNLKRLLAYSTIANSGLLLILLGINGITPLGLIIFFVYIIVYLIANTNIFNFLIHFNLTKFHQLPLLNYKHLVLGSFFLISIFSYAGIPPFVGFVGKLLIISWAYYNNYTVTTILIIIYSLVSIVYYLKLIQYMYFTNNTVHFPDQVPSILKSCVFIFAGTLLILFTFNPSLLFLIATNLTYSFTL